MERIISFIMIQKDPILHYYFTLQDFLLNKVDEKFKLRESKLAKAE